MKKLFAVFTVIILFCMSFTACGTEMPDEEIPVSANTSLTRTGVVYGTDGTYLIPVIAETQLSEDTPAQLLTGLQNISEESLGLSSVFPEDAALSVTQNENTADVAIVGNTENMNAEQIVCSVVNTLTQCGGIDNVQFSVNGISENFGSVDISQPISEYCLNPAYEIGDLKPFQVFFQNENELLVPVTKATDTPSPEVYIKAMMTIPKNAASLSSLFPEGTELNSAVLTDGTLSLDFSGELYGISALPAAEERLLTAINTTCRQLEGVERVAIYVDGVEYTAQEKAASVFANRLTE